MRKICVATGSRADYGLLHGVLQQISSDPSFELHLIVTGSHVAPQFGETRHEIEADGIPILTVVPVVLENGTPQEIASAMADIFLDVVKALQADPPEIVVVLGDRTEIFAVAQAAWVCRVPLAHIHGGETTEGAMDDAARNAITMMAQLHFAAAAPYAERIVRMGRDPEFVHNVGALGVDNIVHHTPCKRDVFFRQVGMAPADLLFLVTYHPVTMEMDNGLHGIESLCAALDNFKDAAIIITGVNADIGNTHVQACIDVFAKRRQQNVIVCASLGRNLYASALYHADVVIGNSSSGIIEAPAAQTPTVNIGTRQTGRLKAASIIDCGDNAQDIAASIQRALSSEFLATASSTPLPYGKGDAASSIIQVLQSTLPD